MLLDKKAEMGIGVLIIFIALIMVAAVAASVLMATTSSLQNKALATGKEAKGQISTSISVLQIYAEDGSSGNAVDEFTEEIRLSAGSDPISLSDLLLTVTLDNASADYSYNSSINCSTAAGNPLNTTAGGEFGVQYALQGSNFLSGYLNKGDIARICFQSPRIVGGGELARFRIVPKIGLTSSIEAHLPELIVNVRESIYP